MLPTPGHSQSDEPARDKEVNNFVHDVKEDGEKEARAGILDVQFYPQRRGAEADDGLGDSVETDGMVSQSILQDAYDSSCHQPRQRTATRGCKSDRY